MEIADLPQEPVNVPLQGLPVIVKETLKFTSSPNSLATVVILHNGNTVGICVDGHPKTMAHLIEPQLPDKILKQIRDEPPPGYNVSSIVQYDDDLPYFILTPKLPSEH